VQHGPEHLDVFLNAPSDVAPDGWRAEADGAVWTRLASTSDGEDLDPVCAAPLLVTIGQPDDGGQIYLDLEADGVVSLTGDMATARSVARSILTELAFTPLADTLEVLVVGDLAPPDAKALDHVNLADSWDDVRDDLAAWAEQSHQVLVENGWPNPFLARGDEPYHDGLAPVAVIAHEPPPTDLLDLVLAQRPATLVVVALGEMHGATVVECAPDSLTLPDVGLVCTPHPVEAEALDAIIDLVESADDPGTPVDDLATHTEGQFAPGVVVEPSAAGPDPDLEEDPEFDVLVRTLGDIRVEGGDPLAPKQTAVVAYIALHEGVTTDRLEEAVWASATGTSRRKRLANTLSECRALLGRRHLPAAVDGRYKPGPGVMTDLELFDRRVRRAADQPPIEAADTLLSAMELATGRLFNYRNSDRATFAWVDLENWVSIWELKVAAVAQKCADLLLDLGRTDEAVEVSLHALSIIPTHTSLTETLMRAHAANGDRLAVQRVYEEHVGALETLDLDDAEESTTELCERLLGARAG
jgi:DNA-binding SARP family transcriptional activator